MDFMMTGGGQQTLMYGNTYQGQYMGDAGMQPIYGNGFECQVPMNQGYVYGQQMFGNQGMYSQEMGYPQAGYGMYPQDTGYLQMGYGVPQQNMGYPQAGYGVPQQNMGYGMQQVRYSRQQIIQAIRDFCINSTGVPITREVKVEETPDLLRHACVEVGDISFLELNRFPVPEMGLNVAFYFCTKCGKLYYEKDFIY